MARPKKVMTKECVLHIRVDKKMVQKLDMISKKNNMTKANFIRHSIESACGQIDTIVFPQLTEENIKVLNLLVSLNDCLNALLLQTRKLNNATATGQGLTEESLQKIQTIKERMSMLAEGLEMR